MTSADVGGSNGHVHLRLRNLHHCVDSNEGVVMPTAFAIVYYVLVATEQHKAADVLLSCFIAWAVLKVLP